MEQNGRPHSRQKTVGSGSANVGRGSQVNNGSRPVGAGGRNQGSSQRAGGYSQGGSYPVMRLSPKSILALIIVAVIVIALLKSCGAGLLSGGNYSDLGNYSGGNFSTHTESFSADTSLDTTVSPLAREKYVTPLGGGKDTVTVMVYMCGTDLESKHGMATKDLQEMLNATISEKVNVIVETGGCAKWNNSVISSAVNQIYKVEDEGLRILEKNAGTSAMTNPQNLTDFIKYCEKNYPADRNVLIFWDHGGGSITGYGYDEKNPSSSSMTLAKIDSALKNAGVKFDCIGFDACLMATLENALVCNEYADYLLASEETEPGTGWYYTNWLTELSENTSIPTTELAKTIIDDFISSCRSSSPSSKITLSLVDLAELDGTVPKAFRNFAASTTELIKSNNYAQVSNARAGVRQFAQSSKLNQVDLVDLAQRLGTDEGNALAEALKGCVKYNRSSIDRCNGISIYFPYESTKSVGSAISSYEDIGLDDEYTKCIKSFASLEYGGQIAAGASQVPSSSASGGDLLGTLLSAYLGQGASTSPISILTGGLTQSASSSAGLSVDPSTIINLLSGFKGRSMPAGYDWVDTDFVAGNAKQIAEKYINPARLTASYSGGRKVLNLSDAEWNLIQTVELNVFAKDGDGYIDLGLDNTFDWYNNNALLLEYDGTWLALNDHVCAYYLVSDTEEEDGTWTTVGRIPALLNGETVNLQVVFDAKHPEGVVTGAYPMYEDELVSVEAKGNIKIKAGDKLELLCDYYDLDGNYSASYSLGESFTVPSGGLSLENLEIVTQGLSVTYRLTDIYGNHYWIEAE